MVIEHLISLDLEMIPTTEHVGNLLDAEKDHEARAGARRARTGHGHR